MSKQDVRTSSRNIGPQHQKYSSIFHCTHGVLFYPCVHQTHLECLLLKTLFEVPVMFDFETLPNNMWWCRCTHIHTHTHTHRLKGRGIGNKCFALSACDDSKGKHVVVMWCRIIFKVFWPRNPTFICNSPAVVLGESLATKTFLLTVH